TPMDLLERYGSDAVRYWAASARPGTDTAFDEGQMKIGRKLAIKLLNVSRFVLAAGPSAPGTVALEPLDADLLSGLAGLVEEATTAFDGYDYARALERTESFFWDFCDDYVELVKNRAYGSLGDDRAAPARHALRTTLSTLLRLFAPFLPFVTEEVWSWWQDGSVHRAEWPAAEARARPAGAGPAALDVTRQVLAEIRRRKTEAGVSLRAAVAKVEVSGPGGLLDLVAAGLDDLKQAGAIEGDVILTPTGDGGEGGEGGEGGTEIRVAEVVLA
ncbi:MAG TPA: class I tRNA ligase family protein, partial [Acidimicrobiales bacterium]|nr:class I tRNA ligase family protein [Acidimicrobiales bacterium]